MVLIVNTRLRALLNREHWWEFRELIHPLRMCSLKCCSVLDKCCTLTDSREAGLTVLGGWWLGDGGVGVQLQACCAVLVPCSSSPFPLSLAGGCFRRALSLLLEEGLSSWAARRCVRADVDSNTGHLLLAVSEKTGDEINVWLHVSAATNAPARLHLLKRSEVW